MPSQSETFMSPPTAIVFTCPVPLLKTVNALECTRSAVGVDRLDEQMRAERGAIRPAG